VAAQRSPAPTGWGMVLAEGVVASLTAVLSLILGVPLRFVHVYAGDYLASALWLAGVAMLAANWRAAVESWQFDLRKALAAAALAIVLTLAVGAWANWETADLWMNAERWERFAALLPFLFVACFSEEAWLGPVRRGKCRVQRFGIFLGVRAALWLSIVLAYFELSSGQALLPILALPLAGFSVLQRLAADALRNRTGNAVGTAVFDAILAAWFVAAVFPIT
jgi:hypothetical protein